LACVKLNGEWGAIDKVGNTVIPAIHDYIWVFSEGLASIRIGNDVRQIKWGFIDKNGREVIPFIYDEEFDFSEGLARVKLDGKWGFIDKTGNIVIPFKYDLLLNYPHLLLLMDGSEY